MPKGHRHVDFFRSFPLFCTASDASGTCGSVVPGTSAQAYTDTRHLRRAGAMYLWPFFCSAYEAWGLFSPMP